ncbi:hypothetical protein SAMN02982989_2827 [Xaviernesmea oryzae]|uniref:Antitoxin FitA-like ribbon-helix-helix domain-containing protein n=1 Tax=Xaviernesmea oryzae TaxID=464029 RepID=A0A1X7FEG9_9HYPH|nr:hypothetical protein [Xaviernesmea oryzae]SMF50740.1 hypothetical protein SAMN02982989_2827 [Xaviernesmea oryzae]
MNAITIRNLSDEASRALEARAAQNGRSTEAEVEKILEDILLPEEHRPPKTAQAPKEPLKVGTLLREFGREFGGLELEIKRDPTPIRPASFE